MPARPSANQNAAKVEGGKFVSTPGVASSDPASFLPPSSPAQTIQWQCVCQWLILNDLRSWRYLYWLSLQKVISSILRSFSRIKPTHQDTDLINMPTKKFAEKFWISRKIQMTNLFAHAIFSTSHPVYRSDLGFMCLFEFSSCASSAFFSPKRVVFTARLSQHQYQTSIPIARSVVNHERLHACVYI